MVSVAQMLEKERLIHAAKTAVHHKEALGQYFTPYPIARFMASLFPVTDRSIRLLDPGAGIGVLACAFMERVAQEGWNIPDIQISAYDIDKAVLSALNENISLASAAFKKSKQQVFFENFLEKSSFEYIWKVNETYTHIIMNPPYKKIRSNSRERQSVRAFGLETVNLYSAFMGAAIALTEDKGFIVAIVPRSFCNGVYYKSFREFILHNCAIRHIHLFESRDKAFKDEAVLQENIIIMLQKNAVQESVKVTHCKDASFTGMTEFDVPFSRILREDDSENYFHIPTGSRTDAGNAGLHASLEDLGVQVSTGPVVDFRVKDLLLRDCTVNSVPLVYPVHLKGNRLSWPQESKKPNAILVSAEVRRQLFPRGFYVLVKRFSAKEEAKRIVASLITPDDFIGDSITFENHLNVFHVNKSSLSENLAYGLVCWLNSTYIDGKFRLFSGHTQVNATDLRNLPYPGASKLEGLGKELKARCEWSQEIFDQLAKEAAR